ncbi:MAG TPA: UV damage endonuclease UvsE [Methanocella sp.]|nr:UV damage endonuclease UvsE [Methanocella sp.]
MRIGFAAIPYNQRLLPVTSKKSTAETVERLENVVRYVASLGIDFYRIPANISPGDSLESIEEAREQAKVLGCLVKQLGIRTCFHTTYFCILNSPEPGVLEQSIQELRCLTLFDRHMGGGNHIELHGGGSYGNREAAIGRLISAVNGLDEDIVKLLRLENEEHPGKIGTVAELERISGETGLPLLFDVAHYRVNRLEPGESVRDIVRRFIDTWTGATTYPVLHYSTTAPDKGTHLPINPGEFWAYIEELRGLEFDVMLETKEKEQDVLRVKAEGKKRIVAGG